MAHAPCGYYAYSSLLSTATVAARAISHRRIVHSSVVGLLLLCRSGRFRVNMSSLKVPQERTPRMRGVSAMVCLFSTSLTLTLTDVRES